MQLTHTTPRLMARIASLLPALMLCVPLLQGCGNARYLVGSRGTLPADLDVHCIAQALAADPAGANARLVGPGSIDPLDKPTAADPVHYTWSYGEGGHSYITIDRQDTGWRFENQRFLIGNTSEKFGMFRFEPIMKSVNAAIAARCNLRITEPSLS